MASSADLIAEAEASSAAKSHRADTAILPILIVPDATLWEARYQATGSPEPIRNRPMK